MGGTDLLAEVHIALAEILYPAAAIPAPNPRHEGAAAVTAGRQSCIAVGCSVSTVRLRYYLSALKKLDPENYAAALYDYLNDPRAAMKMIANPIEGTGFYSVADPVMLRFVPRPVDGEEDTYQIFEYYEATQLQTLLKMDFYKALSAGHVVRRCEYCGRYFLLTKGYHTKYCDIPNPQYPEFTCAQLGYRQTGLKEAAKDDPIRSISCLRKIYSSITGARMTIKSTLGSSASSVA